MGKSTTNLIVVLGLITLAFGGYYLYSQNADKLSFETDDQAMQDMLRNTRAFIGYGNTLNRVKLDIEFFEDRRFTSLRSYSTPIESRPIGRPDPFAPTTAVNPASRNF